MKHLPYVFYIVVFVYKIEIPFDIKMFFDEDDKKLKFKYF